MATTTAYESAAHKTFTEMLDQRDYERNKVPKFVGYV